MRGGSGGAGPCKIPAASLTKRKLTEEKKECPNVEKEFIKNENIFFSSEASKY